MQKRILYLSFIIGFAMVKCLLFCTKRNEIKTIAANLSVVKLSTDSVHVKTDTAFKTIHVYVALCDNKYQGIVPVPKAIGNGQNPANNLYWGCGYGVKTFFKNSKEWTFLKAEKIDSTILERIVFKHKTKKFFLIADAYNGKFIEKCTVDFMKSSSGKSQSIINIDNKIIGVAGLSKLLVYIGHNGLMDFDLTETFVNTDKKKRDVIALACYSKNYFSSHLSGSNINPIVWSTHLMAPEAYITHNAISGYVLQENNEKIKNRAAAAYAKYQKCSLKTAKKLLVSGW